MYPLRISLVICVRVYISREYIYCSDKASSVARSLQRRSGIHKTRQPYWKHSRTHITSDMCIPTGKRISQVTCVWGYTCHTLFLNIYYTYIIVTTPVHYVVCCRAQWDTHNTAAILEGGTHITSDMCIPYAYHK